MNKKHFFIKLIFIHLFLFEKVYTMQFSRPLPTQNYPQQINPAGSRAPVFVPGGQAPAGRFPQVSQAFNQNQRMAGAPAGPTAPLPEHPPEPFNPFKRLMQESKNKELVNNFKAKTISLAKNPLVKKQPENIKQPMRQNIKSNLPYPNNMVAQPIHQQPPIVQGQIIQAPREYQLVHGPGVSAIQAYPLNKTQYREPQLVEARPATWERSMQKIKIPKQSPVQALSTQNTFVQKIPQVKQNTSHPIVTDILKNNNTANQQVIQKEQALVNTILQKEIAQKALEQSEEARYKQIENAQATVVANAVRENEALAIEERIQQIRQAQAELIERQEIAQAELRQAQEAAVVTVKETPAEKDIKKETRDQKIEQAQDVKVIKKDNKSKEKSKSTSSKSKDKTKEENKKSSKNKKFPNEQIQNAVQNSFTSSSNASYIGPEFITHI